MAEAFGDYVVYEQLGVGGMATVHRAEQRGIAGFSKQVALKRMLPSAASNASLVRSFIREAQLASHMRHGNVAQTYDLGKVGDVYFIAMELVTGRNLREILKHCASVAGNMPLPIAMNIVNQIADALDYAHNLCDESGAPLGIIHRDVSPSNIIVGEGGTVKLIDFGIAKAKGQGQTTLAGTIKGKFSYLAPEALFGHVDARSDLFALGVIAYELLTNRPLFQGKDDMDTLTRVKDMPIPPPSRHNPQVPAEIDNIIMTALERDAEKRWQRATAMRQALTTETKRVSLIAHNQEVIDWIDSAFARSQFDADSEPSISISSNTMELAQGSPAQEVPDDFLTAGDSLATTVKPSTSRPFQAQDPGWSDVSTADRMNQPAHREHGFDVSTITDRPAKSLESTDVDWNAPSAVQTMADRPSAVAAADWNAPSAVETRADRPASVSEWHGASDVDTNPQRPSSPHVVQRTPQPLRPVPALSRMSSAPPTVPTRPTPQPMNAQRPSQPHMEQRPSQPYEQQRSSQPHPEQRPSSQPPVDQHDPQRPSQPQFAQHDPRPSQPHLVPRSSIVPTLLGTTNDAQRPSQPMPALRAPSPQLPARPTPQPMPAQLPPLGAVPSGARTLPNMQLDSDAAATDVKVSASAVLHEQDVGAVLSDLEQRSSVIPNPAASAARTHPVAPRDPGTSFLLAVLVLIAAGGAAAVVYFALPYLT